LVKARIMARRSRPYPICDAACRHAQAAVRAGQGIRRLSLGNPGDVKPVGEGVSELRLDFGPGYRIYYVQRGPLLIILLAGGDKSSQRRDIQTALALARQL
jgi:putative addiction module killer protein